MHYVGASSHPGLVPPEGITLQACGMRKGHKLPLEYIEGNIDTYIDAAGSHHLFHLSNVFERVQGLGHSILPICIPFFCVAFYFIAFC